MSECVTFQGWSGPKGYGMVHVGKRNMRAHRAAWEAAHGPIPSGLFVCHACDNRACVNVEHLFLGTAADNNRDMRAKGRAVMPVTRGERNCNARLTEAQVVNIVAAFGGGATCQSVARQYGISESQAQRIRAGTSWKHVARAVLEAAGMEVER